MVSLYCLTINFKIVHVGETTFGDLISLHQNAFTKTSEGFIGFPQLPLEVLEALPSFGDFRGSTFLWRFSYVKEGLTFIPRFSKVKPGLKCSQRFLEIKPFFKGSLGG